MHVKKTDSYYKKVKRKWFLQNDKFQSGYTFESVISRDKKWSRYNSWKESEIIE